VSGSHAQNQHLRQKETPPSSRPVQHLPAHEQSSAIHAARTDEARTAPRLAYQAVKDGTATENDFDTLAAIANVAMVCSEPVSQDLVEICQQAQARLMQVKERKQRTGRWGFDGVDMQLIPPVLDLHEQYLQHCTHIQMATAMREVLTRMGRGHTLKTPS